MTMSYKVIIIAAGVAAIVAFGTGRGFHRKAALATAELEAAQHQLAQAQTQEREENEQLQALIRAEGDLSERDVQRKAEEVDLKESAYKTAGEELKALVAERDRLINENRELENRISELQRAAALAIQTAANSRVNTPDTYANERETLRAEIEDFLETLVMTPSMSSSTWRLYQTRLLTLLPLIQQGSPVDVTLPETKGNTALHYACGMGRVDIVEWLVNHGADVNKLTDKGKSPLDCVGGGYNAAGIRQLLLQRGARKGR